MNKVLKHTLLATSFIAITATNEALASQKLEITDTPDRVKTALGQRADIDPSQVPFMKKILTKKFHNDNDVKREQNKLIEEQEKTANQQSQRVKETTDKLESLRKTHTDMEAQIKQLNDDKSAEEQKVKNLDAKVKLKDEALKKAKAETEKTKKLSAEQLDFLEIEYDEAISDLKEARIAQNNKTAECDQKEELLKSYEDQIRSLGDSNQQGNNDQAPVFQLNVESGL